MDLLKDRDFQMPYLELAAENPPITFNLWILTLNATYNLDLFGGNQRELDPTVPKLKISIIF